jgi:hypothetical protein
MTILIILLAVIIIVLAAIATKYYLENQNFRQYIESTAITHKELSENRLHLFLLTKKLGGIIIANYEALKKDKLPFKALNEITGEALELTAIRFKKTEKEVLIYINGAMVPFIGDIKLNHEDWITPSQLLNIVRLTSTLRASANTGINNTKQLKEINNLLEN